MDGALSGSALCKVGYQDRSQRKRIIMKAKFTTLVAMALARFRFLETYGRGAARGRRRALVCLLVASRASQRRIARMTAPSLAGS